MKARVVLLAAGQASRMGAVKALLPLPLLPGGGECSALEGLARLYRGVGVEDILVVSGFHAPEVEAAAHGLGLAVARNSEPEQGMLSSVRVGLRALPKGEAPIFVHPADVPLVRPLTLIWLLEQAQDTPSSILIPAFDGREGHPPLLPGAYAHSIAAGTAEGGLRAVMAAFPRRQVAVPDAFILEDMDRPEDYMRLQSLAARHAALSPDEAVRLLRCRHVPERGMRHARAVGAVARALACALARRRKEAGLEPGLDPDLALAGGLVHDICKGAPGHEAAGAGLLRNLGLGGLAILVEDHRDLSLPDAQPLSERELVYLADKYCCGGSFVSLEQRFGRKLELFAADPQACEAILGRLGRAGSLEARLGRELEQEPAAIARQALAVFETGRAGK